MRKMNRQERRQLDKVADKSIKTILEELAFLNAAGNPKYKLVKQSDFAYKAKIAIERMAFWR